jgi:heme/copper-type cytochrome/quinol oxidase subunit 2
VLRAKIQTIERTTNNEETYLIRCANCCGLGQ